MDMDRIIVVGGLLAMLYFMIFHTAKWKEINQAGYDNLDKTGKVIGSGVRGGLAIWKLFKRR